jgi:peptidoglycan lytic transglycosylase D
MWKRIAIRMIIAGTSLILLGATIRAQSPIVSSGDDPVKRAREKVQAAVEARVAAADRVIEASKLIRESAEARKQGKREQAMEVLERANRIAAEADQAERNSLVAELLRRLTDERAALSPRTSIVATPPVPNEQFAKGRFQPVLTRYAVYRNALTRILLEENLPPELLAVALVESGLNPLALSPKGALGIWQLMPATAERYGLIVETTNDHRTHPEHSTRAAAQYLRDLYRQFGDWKLALAGYNWGEDKVQRVINKTGIRDFDEMARRGLLPLETRRYVPAVMAIWAKWSDRVGADTK